MNAVVLKVPKVHLRKSSAVVTPKPELTPTDLVLRHLTQDCSTFRRAQYRRQCQKPATMSKTTLWALHQLRLKLQRDNAGYYRLQLEEINRLVAAAPSSVRSSIRLTEA
jgi:hypothetical protein